MATRRGFLSGLLATGLMPQTSWAEVGGPTFLIAAQMPDRSYKICGLSAQREILFALPLPGRGHAGIAHPDKAEAVIFARRPGNFAYVITCTTGNKIAELTCPKGRHFYGHGVFSAGGSHLFTTENDYEAGRGVIGVWDRNRAYARVAEFSSGGTGPHEIARLSGTDILVIANGGIETHPESGRAKLNLPIMRPNLSYVSAQGELLQQMTLDPAQHLNSIRHLCVRSDGLVAFGMQWQGDRAASPPLLGFHLWGQAIELGQSSARQIADMQGYVGSLAFSHSGAHVAITSPRGGCVQVFDANSRELATTYQQPDVCGVGLGHDSFVVTTGTGDIATLSKTKSVAPVHHDLRWDNHLVQIL